MFLWCLLVACSLALAQRPDPSLLYPAWDWSRPELLQTPLPSIHSPALQTTLKEAAAGSHRFVGAAFTWPHATNVSDPGYDALLTEQYSLTTLANGCKWTETQPQRDVFNLSTCIDAATYASRAGLTFRGHNLCWGNYNPAWLVNGTFKQAELVTLLKSHITTLVSDEYLSKMVYSWDVVNEACSDHVPGLKAAPPWYPAVPDYIDIAFQTAAAAAPAQSKLFYNDYGGEGLGMKSQSIYDLVQGMKQRGVPLDGVGLQMHVSVDHFPDPADVRTNMMRLGALGLDVHITEMDVAIPGGCQSPGSNVGSEAPEYACNATVLQRQATVYAMMLQACLDVPACKSFETWGFTDKYSWLNSKYGMDVYPLPWTGGYDAKPAVMSMLSVFHNDTSRRQSDPLGIMSSTYSTES